MIPSPATASTTGEGRAARGDHEPAAPAEGGYDTRFGAGRALQPASPDGPADPRNTKNSVYVHPSMFNFQSHVLDRARAMKPMSAGQANRFGNAYGFERGSQNTENP